MYLTAVQVGEPLFITLEQLAGRMIPGPGRAGTDLDDVWKKQTGPIAFV